MLSNEWKKKIEKPQAEKKVNVIINTREHMSLNVILLKISTN